MRRKKTSLIQEEQVDFDIRERDIFINELTKVVNDFLRNTSKAFKNWYISEIVSDKNSVAFSIDNTTGATDCYIDKDHYTDVSRYLPNFKLTAPIYNSNNTRLNGASVRVCHLTYNIPQGEKQYKRGKRLQFLCGFAFFIFLLAFLFFTGAFIKHTDNDADRFAALWK